MGISATPGGSANLLRLPRRGSGSRSVIDDGVAAAWCEPRQTWRCDRGALTSFRDDELPALPVAHRISQFLAGSMSLQNQLTESVDPNQ